MCPLPKLRAGIELQGTYILFNALECVLWANVGVKAGFRPGLLSLMHIKSLRSKHIDEQ